MEVEKVGGRIFVDGRDFQLGRLEVTDDVALFDVGIDRIVESAMVNESRDRFEGRGWGGGGRGVERQQL